MNYKKWSWVAFLCLPVLVVGGCTSLQQLDVSYYKGDPSVLTDGEYVEVTTTNEVTYIGTIAKRDVSSVTVTLKSGENMTFPVENISHFSSKSFSAAKTTGLVVAVAGGLTVIWLTIVAITLVGVLVAIPVALAK